MLGLLSLLSVLLLLVVLVLLLIVMDGAGGAAWCWSMQWWCGRAYRLAGLGCVTCVCVRAGSCLGVTCGREGRPTEETAVASLLCCVRARAVKGKKGRRKRPGRDH